MLRYLKSQSELLCPDTLFSSAAMTDWSEINLFTGCRRIEWAQPAYNWAMGAPQLDIFQNAAAFCLGDLIFFGERKRRLTLSQVLLGRDSLVWAIQLTWRTQKNGNNNETKLYTRNPREGGHMLVQPMLNVVRRFVKLRGEFDFFTLLAIFQDGTGPVSFITS
jgi:hypothetical protein